MYWLPPVYLTRLYTAKVTVQHENIARFAVSGRHEVIDQIAYSSGSREPDSVGNFLR